MLHKMLKDSKDVQGYFYTCPLLLNSFILLFVYLSILPTCMSVYPWGSAEGVGSPKTGITNICESLCGSRGLNQGLLKEQTGIFSHLTISSDCFFPFISAFLFLFDTGSLTQAGLRLPIELKRILNLTSPIPATILTILRSVVGANPETLAHEREAVY